MKQIAKMNSSELIEKYGENAPKLINHLAVLDSIYGENTTVLAQIVHDLHIKVGSALLFGDEKMSYPQITDNSFFANGKKFIVHGTINQAEFEKFEQINKQIETGQNLDNFNAFVEKIQDAIDRNKISQIAILTHQYSEAISCEKQTTQLVMLACTLFLKPENSKSEWNEAGAIEIVKDWQSIPYAFFLVFYELFKATFTESLKTGFRNISMKKKEVANSQAASFFTKLKGLKIGRLLKK